ncbi:MAG TPA: hypothetical protein VM843_07705 [Flavisolibacter sp.]|jgi:uncharacterized protein YceK|nr:hypothetical protein [Flavisolibacter sp.]
MRLLIALSLALTLVGCGSIGEEGKEKTGPNKAVLEGVDSSARMNDSTLLPVDSTNTGVMH